MKNKLNFWKKNWWKYSFAIVLIAILVACSVDITNIIMPLDSRVNAGSVFTTTVKAKWNSAGDSNDQTLVVGFLVPKSWKAALSTTITYTCTPKGANNEPMVLMTASDKEPKSQLDWPTALKKDSRYGLKASGNLVDEVEWVVYKATRTFSLNGGETPEFEIKVVTKAGAENMVVNLGFFIGNTNNGLEPAGGDTYSTGKYQTLTVENGTGDILDYVNPQIASTELGNATDNDIQTIYYDGDVTNTPLSSETDIYLCVKGFTNDNQEIDICDRSDKSKFKPMPGINRFRFDFWPRTFFNLQEQQTLTRLEYYITNKAGTVKVGYGGDLTQTVPFKFTFTCTD